ncbi:sigma-54 dependent transcriptional regulator [Pendulispora rubella]|uniref:Sigma-54 dependent transcriptional regulator n=1 Tax=Pendulispora rubella TaxID=2741070 RepID=A0ABZ2KSL0_9BACT
MSNDSQRDWREDARISHRNRVGLISTSTELIERIETAVAQCGSDLSVASDAACAKEILVAPGYALKIVDHTAGMCAIPHAPCDGCSMMAAMFHQDAISLFVRNGETRKTIQRYASADLEPLVHDVKAILLREESAAVLDSEIIGDSAALQSVREQIRRIGPYRDISVMVLGETGTGKELVAEAIHRIGAPPGAPFVAINCAAVPENLFESELFGHEAGAYTGARGPRAGLLEAGGQGVVFLDEVGDMPLPLQSKLLRVLETRTFRRVGGTRDLPLQARIVSATNGNLELMLRPDLLYRLAGFTIVLPALRERTEDIPLLARAFLRRFSHRHRIPVTRFSETALARLRLHDWPGNVRELRGTVERAAILSRSSVVEEADVLAAIAPLRQASSSGAYPCISASVALPAVKAAPPSGSRMATEGADRPRLRDMERDLILQAYQESDRKLSGAARALGLPRSTLRDKLRRYGVLT